MKVTLLYTKPIHIWKHNEAMPFGPKHIFCIHAGKKNLSARVFFLYDLLFANITNNLW